MSKEVALVGGFVGRNVGNIKECYSVQELRGVSRKKENENPLSGFFGINEGQLKGSYYKHSSVMPSMNQELWEKGDRRVPWRFVSRNWGFDLPKAGDDAIHIHSADSLMKFAERVNQGDKAAQNAVVVLDCDVDLRGRSFVPIGKDFHHAFSGTFDGQGYVIRHVSIRSESDGFCGFFGILRGRVYNLTVEGTLNGGNISGGFAAQNEGVIGCSASIFQVTGKKQRNVGGFVGVNKGEIFQCYSAGSIVLGRSLVLPIGALVGLVCLGILLVFLIRPKEEDSVFRPVPTDSEQEELGEEDGGNWGGGNQDDRNSVSYSINQVIAVRRSEKRCIVNLVNPSGSGYDIVLSISMTNGEADSSEDVIVASSGAVEPGYRLSEVILEDFAVEALSPGTYPAVIHLSFYDREDHSLAMVNSNLEVKLEVTE